MNAWLLEGHALKPVFPPVWLGALRKDAGRGVVGRCWEADELR